MTSFSDKYPDTKVFMLTTALKNGVVNLRAMCAEGLEFKSRADQIIHSVRNFLA